MLGKIRMVLFGTKKRKVTAIVAALALAGASVAAAAWFVLGQGNADSKIQFRALVAPTFVGHAGIGVVSADCAPNDDCDATVRLSNPEENGPLVLTGWDEFPALTSFSVTGGGPGCTSAALSSSVVISASGARTIPVPTGTSDVLIENFVSITDTIPNDCQGATVAINAPVGSGSLFTFETG